MKDGLILDGLKMSNISEMTKKRVQNITAQDLDMILMGLDESEHKMMIDVINSLATGGLTEAQRDKKYIRIGQIIEIVAWRIEQRKVFNKIKREEK